MTDCKCRYAKRGVHGVTCDQERAEYVAGVESAQQAERAAFLEGISQQARWAVPTNLAMAADLGEGFPISGDHRPRLGRLYARGEGEVDSGHE